MKTNSILRVAGLALTILCWRYAQQGVYSDTWAAILMWGGVGLTPLASLAGRHFLRGWPSLERVDRVTVVIHYVVGTLLGCAVLAALRLGRAHPVAIIPVPQEFSYPVLVAVGAVTMLTVVNLALQGLGAPFALALSRKVAAGWFYARTRNPMGLFSLLFAVVLGVWLRSLHFVVWAALWLSPGWLLFARLFEERELELRFGKTYLVYKAATPFLWPRLRSKPKSAAGHS